MNLEPTPAALEFRARFGTWLAQSLPMEWRGRTPGVEISEDEWFEIRRAWGVRLFEGGFAAPTWPVLAGGLGLAVDEQVAYVEELASIGAPDPVNGNAIDNFGPALLKYGTEDQQRSYLRPMLAHEALWCQGFSEPDAGSDLAALRTRAIHGAGEMRLFGQKVWTSGAHAAKWCYMLVRTDIDAAKHAGLSMLIVDMDQPGIEVRPLRQITGGTGFCEVFIDGAIARYEDVIGGLGNGWDVAMHTLSHERTTRMAIRSIALSKDLARLHSIALTRAGVAGLDPDNALAGKLTDAFVRSLVVQSVVKRNLGLAASGRDFGSFAAMGKLTWSECAQQQAALAAEILGPDLARDEHRHDVHAILGARAYSIYGGTSEIQRNLIARAAGLPSLR